jgi:hypothetical protein
MHAPSHHAWVVDEQRQVPPLQTSVARHVLPQLPQLVGSFQRLVQRPSDSHHVCPDGHAQRPLVQSSPGRHALPQEPQFASSVRRSKHSVPHAVCDDSGQRQLPLVHDCDAPQTLPHAPQFARSLVGMHVAPQ